MSTSWKWVEHYTTKNDDARCDYWDCSYNLRGDRGQYYSHVCLVDGKEENFERYCPSCAATFMLQDLVRLGLAENRWKEDFLAATEVKDEK